MAAGRQVWRVAGRESSRTVAASTGRCRPGGARRWPGFWNCWRRRPRAPGRRHPLVAAHQKECYGDLAWANEAVRRGYAVLVHDGFLFGSRRIRYRDVPAQLAGGRTEKNPESSREIAAYNEWSGAQESVVARSLFCAGTTWPGVVLAEDQRALDYLCSRGDVDAARSSWPASTLASRRRCAPGS